MMKSRYQVLKELAGGGEISLLFVDENKTISDKIAPLLRYFFKKVDFVHSCKEALEYFQIAPYNIVITDILFSRENGYDFIQQLKSFDPFQKIIVISSVLERKRVIGLINSVVYGYIMKPINVDQLLLQLEKIVQLIHEKQMLAYYMNLLETDYSGSVIINKEASLIIKQSDDSITDSLHPSKVIPNLKPIKNNKISAKELFRLELIELETIHDLITYSKELEEEVFLHVKLTYKYLNETNDLLGVFSNGLELSGEFREIGYALRGLCSTLDDLLKNDIDTIPSAKMIKTLIDSVIEDLVNWTLHVLIQKDAVDIHYLDASLFANITQLNLNIKSSFHKASDDTEIELF